MGCFPSERSLETEEGEEEERRLMYVAITRARNELYLSYPLIRAGYGGSGDMMQRPSRFLAEIPKDAGGGMEPAGILGGVQGVEEFASLGV